MKPLPEIARCRCGRKAGAFCIWTGAWQVICNRHWRKGGDCWFGPVRKTACGAILAWNKGMEKA